MKALIAALLLLATVGAMAQTAVKILVVYSASDGGHSPMSVAGKPVLEKMGTAGGFTVDFTSDRTVLNDANLAKYPVLVLLNAFPFDLTGPQQQAIQKFVEAGNGWVGIHATGCAQASWPWFVKLLGDVTWVTHANLRDGTLLFEDRTHPVTKNMPASITLKEEWYQFSKSPRPNVRVLAKAGPTGNSAYDNGGDHPMVWCSTAFPKAVYISPGHDPSDWVNPSYVTLVHDAIAFAAPTATRVRMQGVSLGAPLRAERRGDGTWLFRPAEKTLAIDAAGRLRMPDQ